jgi:hypothetical protein
LKIIIWIGSSSITFDYRVFKQGENEPWIEGHNVTVCLDMETFTKRKIPDWLRQRLEKRLRKENLDGKYGIQYTKIVCISDVFWKQIFSVL